MIVVEAVVVVEEPLVVESISSHLGNWLASSGRQPAPELVEQLQAMQTIEQWAAEQLGGSITSSCDEQLEFNKVTGNAARDFDQALTVYLNGGTNPIW